MANLPGSQHAQHIGSQIAANTGGVQYEDNEAGSTLGGVAPTTGQSIHSPVNGASSVPGSHQFQGTQPATGLGATSPNIQDIGLSTGGSNLAHQANAQPTSTGLAGSSANATASGSGTTSADAAAVDDSLYNQAARGAHVAAVKAQELAEPIQPYIQKVQETVGPYVQTAVDNAGPYVQQAREAATPYVEKASVLASQGLQATAAELDKRGVNMDTIQQKTADVSQSLKDYGVAGQARAGEYLQQAVDQVSNDRESRKIFATVFGTIALIWLAFGFSITALLALGLAGGLAAILSRYSRAAVGSRAQPKPTGNQSVSGAGVETHYPNPSHPDNSLNN